MAGVIRSDPYRRASNLAGRSKCVNQEAPKDVPRVKRIVGGLGVPSRSIRGEGHADIADWNGRWSGSPGSQGTACQERTRSESSEPLVDRLGAPAQRRASRISRSAVKSRCVHEWGGWGRLSDDGPGHYNPDPSEDPWGMWRHLMAARNRARRDRLSAVPKTRSRGVRRTDANQAMASECREQA